jgi:hypothetical protein
MNGCEIVLSKPHVLVGVGGDGVRDEAVPGHLLHCRQHALVDLRLAEFVARQVGVDGDHLDHVPAQDGEMLLAHRLHRTGLPRSGLSDRYSAPG